MSSQKSLCLLLTMFLAFIYSNKSLKSSLKFLKIFLSSESLSFFENREEFLINEMAKKEKIDEKLKEKNQIKWVRMMNNYKNIAEEIVIKEIICTPI